MQMRPGCRATRYLTLLVLACATIVCSTVLAQEEEPLVLLDLATLGPPYDFGTWLQDTLADEPLEMRWPDLDEAGGLAEVPSCVVTWSDPDRTGDEVRQLRGHLRRGDGMLYVVGASRAHLAAARSFWAPLHVNVQAATAVSGFPAWGDDPLTQGLPALGATTANVTLSGRHGKPLIRVAGQPVAMSFDWGEGGRAVIVDQALLGDPLSTQRPPVAIRDFLVRCVLWPAESRGAPAPPEPEPEPTPEPEPATEVTQAPPIGPPASKRALVDMGALEDSWPEIKARVVAALEGADLRVREARMREGEPVLTSESLDGVGVLALGSCRDIAQSEAMAVSRFYAAGGRLLLVAHTTGHTLHRLWMIEFNEILAELELSASLARPHGQAEFSEHPITRRLRGPVTAPGGVQIWTYLADTLVEVFGLPAAVAQQTQTSRAVLMDGGLLLPMPGEEEPAGEFTTMLERSVKWLIEGNGQ